MNYVRICLPCLIVLFLIGCTTPLAYKPDEASPQSSTIVVKELESHYVHDDQIEFSAGLKQYDNTNFGLYLFLKNNSQDSIRFDPAAVQCKGYLKDSTEQAVEVRDPDKYMAQARANDIGLALILGVSQRQHLNETDKAMLRKQDILPGQQIEGLVLVSRVFRSSTSFATVVSGETPPTTWQQEVVFESYKIEFDMSGRHYIVSFKQAKPEG
ncbi:MAG: hypothetical protein ACLQDL_04345 [Spirochaetia bacterium]